MLHTESHASDSGAIWWEGRTTLGAKSKLLYSEIALSQRNRSEEDMYIYTFLLAMTDTMKCKNTHLSAVWQRAKKILSAISKVLYSEIALSQTPFRIGCMPIYTFLLRMTDTMTSQNTDLSSWATLYKKKP
jgi:hypothetical protein